MRKLVKTGLLGGEVIYVNLGFRLCLFLFFIIGEVFVLDLYRNFIGYRSF